MKKLILMLLLFILTPGVAFAAQEDVITELDNTIIIQSFEDVQYLSLANNRISYNGGNTITFTGTTQSYIPVDSIYIKLILQRYDIAKGQWVNTKIINDSKNNSSYISLNGIYYGTKGNRYRICSIHQVTERTTTEAKTTYSNIITVN